MAILSADGARGAVSTAVTLGLAWVAVWALYLFGPHFVDTQFGWGEARRHGELYRLLECVAPTLDEHGVEWFLNYGTLLGACREGGVIAGDTDIDIAVVGTPATHARLRAAARHINSIGAFSARSVACGGIYAHVRGDPDTEGSAASRYAAHVVPTYRTIRRSTARIFARHPFWGAPVPVYIDVEENGRALAIPDPSVFPITRTNPSCTLRGVGYPCPRKPGAVLELEYGRDWKTPRRNAHWAPPPARETAARMTT